MDNKKLNANIITNETVFEQVAEQAVDIEFTLPDFLPDINRILKCKAVSMISSKGINGTTINIDGCVIVTVIYLNENNKIFSYEYQYPFGKSFDIKENYESIIINATTHCEYINCRAVTKRKIDIHGAAEIKINCNAKKLVQILSDIDDNDIEINRSSIPATTPMGHSEKYLVIEEEIEIGQGQPDILSLLKYDCNPLLKECKLINGKTIIKGELQLSALYSSEDGNVHTIKNIIPFSQILEIDGVNDECECDTDIIVAYLEIKPHSSSNDETRVLILNAKLLFVSDAHCENDVEIVTDAFSKKYSTDVLKDNIEINKLKKSLVEEFNCKKKIELDNEVIASIWDLWSEINSVKYCFEENKLIISGIITVGIIAVSEEMIPSYYEKNIDFEYKIQHDNYGDNLWCVPKVKIVSSNYTITADGIELRLELAVNACVYQNKKIMFVTDIKLDKDKCVNKSDFGAMIIYFASAGETLWEIAKNYSAGVEEIKKLNNINDDIISTSKPLLIPIS